MKVLPSALVAVLAISGFTAVPAQADTADLLFRQLSRELGVQIPSERELRRLTDDDRGRRYYRLRDDDDDDGRRRWRDDDDDDGRRYRRSYYYYGNNDDDRGHRFERDSERGR